MPSYPGVARVLRVGAVFAGAVAMCLVAHPKPACAELVTFATGRTMSVRDYRVEGAALVFLLRSGGEMVVDAGLVAAVSPDEVPYPELTSAADPAAADPLIAQTTAVAPRVNAMFDPIIRRVAAEAGVDAALVRAVIQVESAYQPRARSRRGAVGLMQVMPATGRQYGITNLYDPTANIRAGVTHLKGLLERFPLGMALAAYNAGEAAVERFAGIPPYPETVKYVAAVRGLVGR